MKHLLFIMTLLLSTLTCRSKTHEVIVSSNVFTPSSLIIEAGDTVRWINTGGAHNVFALNGSFRCAEGCESEGGNGNPSSELWISEVTFRQTGTVPYICQPHIGFGMQGSITVIEPMSVTVHEVVARPDETFFPNDLTILRGDVIRFINDGGEHNINSEDDQLICAESCIGDGTNLNSQPTGFAWQSYVRFNEITEIPYFCASHPKSSTGSIIRVISDTFFANGFE